MAIEDSSTGDIELVVDHCGAMVHSSLLQILTFEKFVGLGVVGDHPPGVPWKLDFNSANFKGQICL